MEFVSQKVLLMQLVCSSSSSCAFCLVAAFILEVQVSKLGVSATLIYCLDQFYIQSTALLSF